MKLDVNRPCPDTDSRVFTFLFSEMVYLVFCTNFQQILGVF